ncbi:HAD-IIB family hydrolase [Motilimonas cestriensis]|uniref:HAD-IIB family hydrolase n=1 Tax=Motilimonas cestriensis TaxID=2742685 RepID=A0ABS8W505_9GAMM|nr:HAD-IIB family hydrolase [Motilimonas cestriensis]MCE2593370.1 HAD-IIB family hydrolase [Motilimonas cestriensis]
MTIKPDLNPIKVLFTDVDDTLTLAGKLPAETLVALYRLQQAGIQVVPVTGACAGWCDQIARLWPVSAVIGENGAFTIESEGEQLSYIDSCDRQARKANRQRLSKLATEIVCTYPKLQLAQDNDYRRYDVAIDFNQAVSGVSAEQVASVLAFIRQRGVNATASSIHINMWLGDNDKLKGARDWLARHHQFDSDQIQQHCAFIGDSANDDVMFGFFKQSIGVANIKQHWHLLTNKPSTVMNKPGGLGFAAWVSDYLDTHP